MTDELVIDGRPYVLSRAAAAACGYTQDYVGQLARSGAIEAQRVGGIWYVNLDSLQGYKSNAEEYKPTQPIAIAAQDPESIVMFDGKDYISASRASKITGYNQDYVGQLARAGKILSRRMGNRWYVEREGLLGHKREKDALLASVQAESVGLQRALTPEVDGRNVSSVEPFFRYVSDSRDLLPVIRKVEEPEKETLEEHARSSEPMIRTIPITVVTNAPPRVYKRHPQRARSSRKTMFSAAKVGVAMTVVIMLAYGMTHLKDTSVYASVEDTGIAAFSASAADAFGRFQAFLEKILTSETSYLRP